MDKIFIQGPKMAMDTILNWQSCHNNCVVHILGKVGERPKVYIQGPLTLKKMSFTMFLYASRSGGYNGGYFHKETAEVEVPSGKDIKRSGHQRRDFMPAVWQVNILSTALKNLNTLQLHETFQ